jgi:hypothetical protein
MQPKGRHIACGRREGEREGGNKKITQLLKSSFRETQNVPNYSLKEERYK